ncbi:MAG: FMN-binding protein [Flavobacteriales bacterium]
MKRLAPYMFILSIVLTFGFTPMEKTLEKVLKKTFDDYDFTTEAIAVPDSIKAAIGNLYAIKINDTVEAYACFSTAFGCKVGGCAKPSDPNATAYETFDYVIVFNHDLSIRALDIANYPGAYGYEICRKGWLKKFVGKTPTLKLGEDVDGITGATISAQFLIDDINFVKASLEALKG